MIEEKTKGKYYIVKRIIKEEYQVFAASKEEALRLVEDPYIVTIIKETIKLQKYDH